MRKMDCTGEFTKLHGDVDLKRELSRIEEIGVETYIEEVFEEKFNWSPLEECFWTTGFNVPYPHEGLGYNGVIEIDDDVFLNHFALTENGIVVAVCEDESGYESYYRIDSED